jgi:hypothetical protein
MPNYKLLVLKDLIYFIKIAFPLSQRGVCDNGKNVISRGAKNKVIKETKKPLMYQHSGF